ncbi:SRPBCC domain-containing protein [Flavobacterium sp.]|uniref:SRPBCC domain-containing protein n=1 Tax=Flavobacterium sp. TaxID=239 RepID=UPI002B4B55FC|nr:SRPBCC domain-containing protein [Flavobacterium sp.]HLF52706.1 SRPBCC domain-containing protein [Flavobacterium sp.]
MKKLEFTVNINAPKEKVWEALWKDPNYQKWTSVFSPGSKAVTDWKEGSKVLFLSEKGDGMYSKIEKSVPNTLMSFKHLGEVKDGQELPINEETKKWTGAMENYLLEEKEGTTSLKVEMDAADEFTDFFNEKFPKALENVKMLAESQKTENQFKY